MNDAAAVNPDGTIETERDTINRLVKNRDELVQHLQSQKEEIEILNNFQKGYKVVETDLNSQIESLKAITELAVKEKDNAVRALQVAVTSLEMSDEILRDFHFKLGQDMDINPSAKPVYLSIITHTACDMRIALEKIEELDNVQSSEIERLTHEQT